MVHILQEPMVPLAIRNAKVGDLLRSPFSEDTGTGTFLVLEKTPHKIKFLVIEDDGAAVISWALENCSLLWDLEIVATTDEKNG